MSVCCAPARWAVAALVVIFTGSFTSGATPPASPPANMPATRPVSLRLEVPSGSARGSMMAAERAVLEGFIRRHPNIHVDPFVRLRIEGPRGEAAVYMAMAGQTAPDALYVYARAIQKYIDQGFLYPLDDYLKDKPQITQDPMFKRLLPTISRDGHVYGIPAKVAVHALLYRKDLFEAAGLDPNHPPETWEELRDYARRLTFPERNQFGLVLPGGAGTGTRLSNFIWQAGGEIVRQLPDGSYRLTLDEKPALTALEFYREMRWGKWERDGRTLEGALRMSVAGGGGGRADVVEGRAAMTIISTTGDLGREVVDAEVFGVAPLPAGPEIGGRRIQATMLEGEFWGINRSIAADTARRDAAAQYIFYLVSDEAREIHTRALVQTGAGMSVSPVWLKKFGYESDLRRMPPQWISFYDRLLEYGQPEPSAPYYDQIATELMSQLDEVMFDPRGDPKLVLQKITDRANSVFFSAVPEEAVRTRHTWARAIAGAILLAALFLVVTRLRRAWTFFAELGRPRAEASATTARRTVENRLALLAWAFMLPAILTILMWNYYPLVRGAALAFTDYRILGDSRFVGLDNFIEAFTQRSFWRALGQTFIYVTISIGVGFLAPIVLAMMLAEIPRAKMLFRTVFYLPAVTSGLVIMFLWKLMYDVSPGGVFNSAAMWLRNTATGRTTAAVGLGALSLVAIGLVGSLVLSGIQRQRARRWTGVVGAVLGCLLVGLLMRSVWLAAPMERPYPFLQDASGYWAMFWVILPGIWAGAGPGCIIYLAAIKSIPEEMYEAADLDGAGAAHKAYHITFQYLRPLIIINFIGVFVGTFHAMENILVMTGGGPGYKTMTIGMDIFFNAFTHLKFGYATAQAWVLGGLLIGFTVYQLRILKQLRFQRASK